MKLISTTLATLLALGTVANAAPGCIGGCLGTAPDTGSIVLPAGYQCQTNWPLASGVAVTCLVSTEAGKGPSIEVVHHSDGTTSTERTK